MEKQKNTRIEQGRNIPALRFPGFDGAWNEKSFGSLFSFRITNSFSRDQLNYEDGNVKNIHYGDIHTKFNTLFDITNQHVPYINNDVSLQRISEDNYCIEGDIIFADASEDLNDVGKSIEIVNLDNQKVLSGLHTILARPNGKSFQVGFVGYLMKSNFVRTQIQKEAQGTKVLSISNNRLSKITIPFPIIPEQKKIASFFTAIDQKISQLKKKHQLLGQYKKGVMQKIFSQEKRFKDYDGKEFLKWERKKFGAVYSFRSTNSFSRQNLNYIEGVVKNIHYGDIHTKFNTLFDITKEIVPFINSEMPIQSIPQNNYCMVGDLVFADASEDLTDVGKCIELVNLNGEQVVAGLHTILARPDLTNMAVGFGGYYMKSSDVRKQIMKQAQGSKVSSISTSRLSDLDIFVPSLPEQTVIANFLSAIDDKIQHTQKQVEQAEQWKKGLMQRMFV